MPQPAQSVTHEQAVLWRSARCHSPDDDAAETLIRECLHVAVPQQKVQRRNDDRCDTSDRRTPSHVQTATKETATALGTAIIGSVLMVATFSGGVTSVLQDQEVSLPDAEREQLIIDFEDALNGPNEAEQVELAEGLDELTGGKIEGIVIDARIDAMEQALEATAGFVVLAFLAATFLGRTKMEDASHPPRDLKATASPESQRHRREACRDLNQG